MKKVILLVAFIVGVANLASAQLKQTPTETSQKTTKSDNELLQIYKSHLQILDKKEEWIRANPEELKIANEQGWFVNAEETRKSLRAKIALIENKTK